MTQASQAEKIGLKIITRTEERDLMEGQKLMKVEDLITDNFQINYPDEEALAAAEKETRSTPPVTNAENIQNTSKKLEAAHRSKDIAVITLGRCDNPVDLNTSIQVLGDESITLHNTVKEFFPKSVVLLRDARGQSCKPRNRLFKQLPGKGKILNYIGGMVNGRDPEDWMPDPSRLVATADQARDVEEYITERTGEHLPASHEALHLAYENCFVSKTDEGKEVLLSADQPWVGDMTRGSEQHIKLLERISNPIAVKIGPKTTPDELRMLLRRLHKTDPASGLRIPGNLSLMFRIPEGHDELTDELLTVVAEEDPEALLIADIHAVEKIQKTGTVDEETGEEKTFKARSVEDVISSVKRLANAIKNNKDCQAKNMQLNGAHFEALGNDQEKECIDFPGDSPKQEAFMDPNLNLSQLRRVLMEAKPYLPH